MKRSSWLVAAIGFSLVLMALGGLNLTASAHPASALSAPSHVRPAGAISVGDWVYADSSVTGGPLALAVSAGDFIVVTTSTFPGAPAVTDGVNSYTKVGGSTYVNTGIYAGFYETAWYTTAATSTTLTLAFTSSCSTCALAAFDFSSGLGQIFDVNGASAWQGAAGISTATLSYATSGPDSAIIIVNTFGESTGITCPSGWTYVQAVGGTPQAGACLDSSITRSGSYMDTVSSTSSSSTITGAIAFGVTLTLGPPPAAPTSFALTALTTTTASFSWTQSAGPGPLIANDFYIFTAISCNGANVIQDNTISVGTTGTATGLTANTQYSALATASNANGESDGSNCVNFVSASFPTAPTGLTITNVMPTNFSATWTLPTGQSLTNVELYLFGSPCPQAALGGQNMTASLVQFGQDGTGIWSGLTPGDEVCAGVQTWNVTGGSTLTEQTVVLSNYVTPGAPSVLTTVANTSTTLSFTWTQGVVTGVLGNSIYIFTGAICGGSPIHSFNVAAGVSGMASGLTPDTVYSAEVTVSNESGESSGSNCAAGQTTSTPVVPPIFPVTLSLGLVIVLVFVALVVLIIIGVLVGRRN